MEKKQSFFSALKDDVVRGLSPGRLRNKPRSRSESPARMTSFLRRKKPSGGSSMIERSGSLRPVMEGPDPDEAEIGASKRAGAGIGKWVKDQLTRTPSMASTDGYNRRSDMRLLLGVMGAPLAPVHVSAADPLPHICIKNTPIETSSAQYILQQYTAASGGINLQNSVKNAYAMGKLKMLASEFESATRVVKNRNSASAAESGGFVLWQMNPDMWYVELSVGGSKVHAGCNGKLVWRHTPWLGAHSAKGPPRPLRRALQGLDPRTTAAVFADAKCIGEKRINGEECFILKLCADPQTLKSRSEGPAEIIRHVLFGYFSQRTGLLVHMEDSHLTRIQTSGGDAVYWETTINSFLDDYRPVEGIMIAHSGRSVVTLFRFGETAMSHTKTRMEEAWTIEEVAFNIPGLSMDCFIPPADLRSGSIGETCELHQEGGAKGPIVIAAHSAKVAAL
ncbi:lipase [Lithospermum erythrorhizon]|uniref:Lipase n=1 Tax=Lithospermum erythrorhizon TaxID=34254 RepID=A0AAV3RXP6_LITER